MGRESFRFAHVAGRVAAGLAVYRCGQYFGGLRVPCGAIAAVAVAPEHRGSGLGTRLVRDAVAALHDDGTALACLFPATRRVYRGAGFEPAGLYCRFRVPAAAIDVRTGEPEIRPGSQADHERLRALYTEAARARDGWLDRPEILWKRNLEPWTGEHFCYLVGPADHPEGYAIYSQQTEGGKHHIQVLDFVALSPGAARRLLAFFGSHRSVIESVTFPDAPGAPLLSLLAEPRAEVARHLHWMLRIGDVRAALECRGYAQGAGARVHLEVRDDLVPANCGRMVLEVEGGRGWVSTGGRGDLRIDVRGLAALYSGHSRFADLVLAGLAEGSQEAGAAAATVFGAPAPWMPDIF